MRNIFIFIRRYFTFLFFLILEGTCLYLLFSYNKYHNAAFMNVANEYSGSALERYNKVQYYFNLKRTNDSLVKENARLYNQLKQDFEIPDSSIRQIVDTIKVDSLNTYRKYEYLQAKVVGNSVSLPNNYIQIARGSSQHVEKDLGVIDINNNVVGTVIDHSNNYGVIMSLLHKQSTISAKLKKSGESGSVIWDGEKPNYVIMKDINKSVKVTIGDSIVTSGFTDRFPYGLLIGRVTSLELDKRSNNYVIYIRTAANFYNLQYVYVIRNLKKDELQDIMKRVKKANE